MANMIRRVNEITFDVDVESGENKKMIFRFHDGKAVSDNTIIAFDHNNKIATISFNYSAFELEII